MPLRPHAACAALLAAALLPAQAIAQERISVAEDPFDITSPSATPPGEVEVSVGGLYERARRGRDRSTYGAEVEIEAGLAPGLDLRVTQQGLYGRAAPRDAEETAPSWGGTSRLGLRWAAVRESGMMPGIGLLGEIRTEYGESKPTQEFRAAALVGKTLVEGANPISAYLNLGWTAAANPERGERPGRYDLAAALGYHLTTDTALVVAYVREQQDRDERDSNIVQAGFRHRLGNRLPELGVAVGHGLGRDSPRWRVGVALLWTFGGE